MGEGRRRCGHSWASRFVFSLDLRRSCLLVIPTFCVLSWNASPSGLPRLRRDRSVGGLGAREGLWFLPASLSSLCLQVSHTEPDLVASIQKSGVVGGRSYCIGSQGGGVGVSRWMAQIFGLQSATFALISGLPSGRPLGITPHSLAGCGPLPHGAWLGVAVSGAMVGGCSQVDRSELVLGMMLLTVLRTL